MVYDLTYNVYFAPRTSCYCYAEPQVADMLFCPLVLVVDPWSFFNGLVGSECFFSCMVEVKYFFVDVLALGIAMFACYMLACMLWRCTTNE